MSKIVSQIWPCPVGIYVLQRKEVVWIGSDLGMQGSAPSAVWLTGPGKTLACTPLHGGLGWAEHWHLLRCNAGQAKCAILVYPCSPSSPSLYLPNYSQCYSGGGLQVLPKLSSSFLVRWQRQQAMALAFFGGKGCGMGRGQVEEEVVVSQIRPRCL